MVATSEGSLVEEVRSVCVCVCVCVCVFVHKLMSEHGLCMCISLLHIHSTILRCSTIIHAH